jgi:hypothetical protein
LCAKSWQLREGGEWINIDEVVDIVGAKSDLPAVTAHFAPPVGATFRLCVRLEDALDGDCRAWTTQTIGYTMEVPPAGETRSYLFFAEILPAGSAPTIASSGYIRVKKLNSG